MKFKILKNYLGNLIRKKLFGLANQIDANFSDSYLKKRNLNQEKLDKYPIILPKKSSLESGFEVVERYIKENNIDTNIEFNYVKNVDLEIKNALKYSRRIFKLIKKINSDLIKSYQDLGRNEDIVEQFVDGKIQDELWDKLKQYVHEKWGIINIGFTKVPEELILKNRLILYPYALILMQELNKKRIDSAPTMEAGFETLRVYESLGKITNDIANWLRNRGIQCQANHPVGGLTVFPALAGKAGMGGQGKAGLLITPEFGSRVRLSTIYISNNIFNYTDSSEHDWIQDYCKTCGICSQICPGGAILERKRVRIENIEGIGQLRTCIDVFKCYKYFSSKYGCSMCMKACPFSKGNGIYDKIKEKFQNN